MDVARRAGEPGAQGVRVGAAVDPGHRVELAPVPVLTVQRMNRAGVVQKGVLVTHVGAETELIRHLGPAVAIVVNVNLIKHVRAEFVKVRPAGRCLERNVIGYERDRARLIGTDKCVNVRAVGHRILGDPRRLAM